MHGTSGFAKATPDKTADKTPDKTQVKHTMANRKHLRILRKGVKAWNNWRLENPNIRPALRRARLSGVDLIGANLSRADLINANLSGADLSGANLSGAKLSEADLTKANLSGAKVSGAGLRGADLSGGHLSGANLNGARLNGAHLINAILRRAHLSRANLSGAFLTEADLSEVDLSGANLREAYLPTADLSGADLRGADLNRVCLIGANLRGADLRGANLIEVEFADIEGNSASLEHAVLAGARFTRKGEGRAPGTFLDLATVEGVETADFGDPDFLPRYLAEAFEYVHKQKLREKKYFPGFVDKAISRIKLLRKLYPEAQPPGALVEAVRAISAELIKHLAKHPEELQEIRPRQFEELIAEILASFGWEVKLTPATRDGGYDLFAISKDDKADVQTSWIIECRKYAPQNKVGIDLVRKLYGVTKVMEGANALLATTSHFTKGARDYKASRYDLELKDLEGVLEWINTYRPNPNGKLYIKDNKLIVPGQD